MMEVTDFATNRSILWRRVDRPGHESARVRSVDAGWQLEGSAVFVENSQPVRLDYRVICDRNWNSRAATVVGWLGDATVDIDVRVSDDGQWSVNGELQPGVTRCLDLDLNFSPSTNLLPVRRLDLAVGEVAHCVYLGMRGSLWVKNTGSPPIGKSRRCGCPS